MDDSVKITEDGHQVDVPIILLVNGESASASEVLTGALKDNSWATVVGTKTFGKGIAQGIFDLPDGSALKLTTAYYYVPSGECIHEVGIEPDLDEGLESMIEIPRDQDNQLKAAMDVAVNGLEESAAALEAEDGAEEGTAEEGQ